MPHDAPAAKKAATLGYGARVVDYDRYREDREEVAQRLVDEKGLSLIPPFNHPDVIAGQGTAAKELFEEVGALDQLRSEEHTSELQSLMRISYAVFCLKKKNYR